MNLRSILFACLAAAQSAQAAPVKVACFGDSVVKGSEAEGKPWPRQIRDVLGRAQFLTANFGGSGLTVVDYAGSDTAYISSDQYEDWQAENDCNDASPYGPYAVGIISLGTNDAKTANLASGESDNFVAEYKSLITNIVEDLWDVGSDLKQLVLCSAVPIADEPIKQPDDDSWDKTSKTWVNTTHREAMVELYDWANATFEKLQVDYVDLYDILSNHPDYPAGLYPDHDRIHPNKDGHAVMANAIAAPITAWCATSGACDAALAGCDAAAGTRAFYPKAGGFDFRLAQDEKPVPDVGGFAAGFVDAGMVFGGGSGGTKVYCDNKICFKNAVNEGSRPLIVYLTADIVTTEKNELKGDDGDLTIDGQGHTISFSDRDALDIRASNIFIRDVHFENLGGDSSAVKVRQKDGDVAHHIVIESCTFSCAGTCEDPAVVVEAPSTFVSVHKCHFEKLEKAIFVRNKVGGCEGWGAGRVTISETWFEGCAEQTPRAEVGWIHVFNSVVTDGGTGEGMVRTDPENDATPEILVEGCAFENVPEKAYENSYPGTIAERDVFMDAVSRLGADEPAAPAPEPNATARRRLDIPAARLLLIDDDERKPGVDCTGRGRDRPDAPVGAGEDVAGCAAEFTVEALRAEYYPRERIYNAGEVGATIDVTLLRNGTVNADHNPYDVQGFAGAPWAGITYGGSDGGHVYCGNETCLENYLETKKAKVRGIAVEGARTIHLTQDMEIGNEQLRRVKDKTIEGHGFTLKFKSSASLFLVLNCSNLVFRDIRFEHDTAASSGADVFYVRDSHHIVWDGCTFDYGECDDDKCDEAIHMAAPATFLTIQRTKFIGYIQGIDMSHGGRYASKDEYGRYGDDQNSPHVTFYACYFENPHSRQPKVLAGRLHMVNCLWIGTPESSFYGVRAQATTTALGTAQPEVLVESSYVEGVDRIWTMMATSEDDNDDVIAEDVKGVIAEANCNLDAHSRVETEVAFFKSDLTWCVPYSYWRMDPFDCNHVTDVKEGAGASWVAV